MQISRTDISPTNLKLSVTAGADELAPIKEHVLHHLSKDVKVPGFRAGKAPHSVVEKNIDQQKLLDEFMNMALNELYGASLRQENIRPVAPPKIELKKFVPYTTLEFDAEITVIGPVKLGRYDNLSSKKPAVAITAKDVADVLDNVALRLADKAEVERPAKESDQVWIDFAGMDVTGQPVPGSSGKDYPLVLGSNTFIPGFEPKLVGMKAGDKKQFDITFPKDYGAEALRSKVVTFDITVNKVEEVKKPKLDDALAAKAGPFKTLAELKDDIKKQLRSERELQARRQHENDLIMELTESSEVVIPDSLIDEQVMKMEEDEKRNLVYRGQTWQEHLDAEGTDEQGHRLGKRPEAHARVKAGLVLSEVAEAEKLSVTPEELEIRKQVLKSQYTDPQMQAELDKPENQRDLMAQILTEKTIHTLVSKSSR